MPGSQTQPVAAAPAVAVFSVGALQGPAAAPVAPTQPFSSRFSDFIARRLQRPSNAPPALPAAEAPAAAEPAVPPVDEKYRLTADNARELERGDASWYGSQFHGRRTASGEAYDKYALTAAHKTLPFGTIVRVRSLALGREVDVRINDRGPFSPGRVIDVSQAAAHALGLTGLGVAEVSLKVAAPLAKMAPVKRSARKVSRRPARSPAGVRRR
ncbi:MAG: septal ring lytic transglycosylase RlpA family protein [Polaromonas sp.]|nr:septal ring lytic transglycosylase RlpA family protein [Polaromonas sp.]